VIKFNFLLTNPNRLKLKNSINAYEGKYLDILDVCGEFQILINENLWFLDTYFAVVEFLKYTNEWVHKKWDKSKDMFYISIETNENPFISFVSKNDSWVIISPWEKFKCNTTFTREEIENALIILENNVNEQLAKWPNKNAPAISL